MNHDDQANRPFRALLRLLEEKELLVAGIALIGFVVIEVLHALGWAERVAAFAYPFITVISLGAIILWLIRQERKLEAVLSILSRPDVAADRLRQDLKTTFAMGNPYVERLIDSS